MTEIALPCPTCSGTGTDTHEDRHAGTNRDTCRTCGGVGSIPATTGQSAEASAPPADTPQTDEGVGAGDLLSRAHLEPRINELADWLVARGGIGTYAASSAARALYLREGSPLRAALVSHRPSGLADVPDDVRRLREHLASGVELVEMDDEASDPSTDLWAWVNIARDLLATPSARAGDQGDAGTPNPTPGPTPQAPQDTAGELRVLKDGARSGSLRIRCRERLPDADSDAGMVWPIEIELPCINGLSCWFTIGNVYTPDRATRGYTEDALNDDLARAFADHIVKSLAAPPPVSAPTAQGGTTALRDAMRPVLLERDRWSDPRFNYGDHREVWLKLGAVRRLCDAYAALAAPAQPDQGEPATIIPEGWVLVPKVPTTQMRRAMAKACTLGWDIGDHTWQQGVANAPPPPSDPHQDTIPSPAMEGAKPPFRTGDSVKHGPSDETWVVAYADPVTGYMAALGWPDSEALIADCTLDMVATDEEHIRWLRNLKRSGGRRASIAIRLYGDPGEDPDEPTPSPAMEGR